MSKQGTDVRKIIAIVLLVLEVIAIIYSAYIQTINETSHYSSIFYPKDNLYMTFSKDIPLNQGDEEVLAPKGSVVLVKQISNCDVGGFYSKTNSGFDEFVKLDGLEQLIQSEDKGFVWYHLTWDCFEEQAKIRELYSEEEQRVQNKIKQTKTYIIVSVIFASLCWLLVGGLLIYRLSKTKWFVLMYVLQIIILFITIEIWPSIYLCH